MNLSFKKMVVDLLLYAGYLKDMTDVSLEDISPWNMFWQKRGSFLKIYNQTHFVVEKVEDADALISESLDKEGLLKSDKFQGDGVKVIFGLYLDTWANVMKVMLMYLKKSELYRQFYSTDAIYDHEKCDAFCNNLNKDFPKNDFVDDSHYGNMSMYFADINHDATQSVYMDEIKQFVCWLSVSIGVCNHSGEYVTSVESFLRGLNTKEFWRSDFENFGFWEPMFVVHKITSAHFCDHVFKVCNDDSQLLEIVTPSNYQYLSESGTVGVGACISGYDLSAFRHSITLRMFMEWMKSLGYNDVSVWEFFNPETGVFSRIFQPSSYEIASCYEEDVSDEDEIFRTKHVPSVFKLVFGHIPKKPKKSEK